MRVRIAVLSLITAVAFATPAPDALDAPAVEVPRVAMPEEVVAYWDTGPPSYRWNELAVAEALRQHQYTHVAARGLALLHVALDDALALAWEATPPYPAEHAVAAGAASDILAYLYPQRAAHFIDRAQEAAQSRLLAGVHQPSAVEAAVALGRAVARQVIDRGRADGSDRPWTGTVPTADGKWRGANPILPQAAGWRPWVLASADELRPPPPPAHDSVELAAEMDEVRRFRRTPKTNADALFWEYAAGGARSYQLWNELLSRKLLERRLDARGAAHAYALLHVALYDVAIACWDAKYAYWAIRPFQLDPSFTPLFPTPQHPSYPSGHSCLSAAAGGVLGHLFPRDAAQVEVLASEASESRLWAGIHFRSDLSAGRALGRAVAERVIARSRIDGGR